MRKRTARRKLSMTSLIDVIFLLLLFFMLSSTFSKFAEVELAAGGAGAATSDPTQKPVFLRLGAEALDLNGRAVALDELAQGLADYPEPMVLVSLREGVTAQRLTDLLVALRGVEGARVTVLEQS
ncbi:ExbD/TolR family protein [Sagittula sp. SSi028]|uniref:ExbD/TolR family protein n=1 Tax=Sagittula sp. SSi028 TaxID=3400636 RepID=UPI003AF89DFE